MNENDNFVSALSRPFTLTALLATIIILIYGLFLIFTDNYDDSQSWLKGEYTEAVDTKEEAIENDYTFYLDGNEIDPKTYNLKNYDLEYNTEDKIVTVSKKASIF